MLSIIIPVLNEAKIINNLLNHLAENLSGENEIEIIVVDGGSNDGTKERILEFKKLVSTQASAIKQVRREEVFRLTLSTSEKGRAKQMNTGAKLASEEILYFLHADSFPPENFDRYIISEVEKGNPAGCFRMKFDNKHWWLQLAGWLTKFKWQGCRGGDQSQFITKELFEEIGGFDENFIIYEDNVLISELYKRKKFVIIPHSLTTSARRYNQQGIWNLQYHFWIIHLKQWLGADSTELHNYYKKHIENKTQKSLKVI